MQIKDRISLKIESVAFGGAGVGRHDGFVIFVPFTAPDDIVEIEIIQRKKTFARGRLLTIISPSSGRTEPLCRYFGVCGGCAYQHIRYEQQLEMKRRQVEDAFIKIGRIAAPHVEAVIGSPQVYAYRGKATVHAVKTATSMELGFMDISGGAVADIERCDIMHETINDQIRRLRAAGEISSHEEDVTFWSGQDNTDETIIRRVKDRKFLVPRNGFFQANLYLTDRMVDEVCRLAGASHRGTVIDACCGCGLFSMFLAPYASRIIGVEINEQSIHYANLNALNMSVKNTEFIRGDVGNVLKEMAGKKEVADMMILDPPRTGLEPETIAAISSIKPADIIYISCNPATQARDVRAFCETGYDLRYLQPLDMFPQTQHIETIVWLRRNPAA